MYLILGCTLFTVSLVDFPTSDSHYLNSTSLRNYSDRHNCCLLFQHSRKDMVDVIGLEPITLRFSLSTFSCCLDYVFTIGFYTLRYWALMKDYCLGCSPSSLCTFRVTNCHSLGLAQSCRRNFPFSSRMINPELTACR